MNQTYSLYAHHNNDRSWNDRSYLRIYQIDTVDSFWKIMNTIDHDNICSSFQLFLMKNKIKPKWEDPENKSGGCWSYKIKYKNKEDIHDAFVKISIGFICNTLLREKNNNINGINIIVKQQHFIIKLWLKTMTKTLPLSQYIISVLGEKTIQRGISQIHKSNIKRDFRKKTFYQYKK